MQLIRPEAARQLLIWREALIGAVVLAAGAWLLARPGYVLPGLGGALALAGLAMTVLGFRRARFMARGDGPGVVQVVEGQIAYFGPQTGGVVALDDITALSLDAEGAQWLIRASDGRLLTIPRAASGAETLFDAFASLDGLNMPRLLRAIEAGPKGADTPIWRRKARVLLT